MSPRIIQGLILGVACVHVSALPVAGQPAVESGKWEVEIHAGASTGGGISGGTGIGQFPVGVPLPTGAGTATSRRVSSWYFGDGALLLNQTNTALGGVGRMTPLDSVLTTAIGRLDGGTMFGFRVGRSLTPRISADFSFDYAQGGLRMTDQAVAAIERTRLSFVDAWNGLLATGAIPNPIVTSESEVEEGGGHQLLAVGAVNIHLFRAGRFVPYVTAGGGGLFNRGTAPSAALTGNYRFSFAGIFPINETDRMTLGAATSDRAFVGVVGGGFKYGMSARDGLRVDVRVHLSGSGIETLAGATPSVVFQSPAFVISTGTIPSIQFSNSQVFNRPSSLSGPVIDDLNTFKGSGVQSRVSVTAGYFFRF
jgi:hypothetical protein